MFNPTKLLIPFFLIGTALGQVASPPNIAAIPADRLSEPWWAARHSAILSEIKEHPDAPLLLLGDSITQNYEKSKPPDEDFQPTWQTFYASRQALNLGYSGDTTSNLLWRIDHGELDGLHPKVAVVLIGTNNTAGAKQTAAQTEVGIDAVIAHLEGRLLSTRILLIGVLPSDISPAKSETDREINRYLARIYSEHPRVTYLDIGSIFMHEGKIASDIFYDPRLLMHPGPLHPDTIGQRKMAEAIEPTLSKLMGDKPQVPLVSMGDINTALIPVEKLEQDSYDWYARHHAALAVGKTVHPRIVLIGDSITHFWGGQPGSAMVNGPTAWAQAFGDTPVLNLGFGWDRTQNVLWRLRQGELDGLHPDFIVLNIGTNNLTGTVNARANTPAEVAEGIRSICQTLEEKSPRSKIILMSIFPRGLIADAPLREPIRQVNQLLAKLYAGDQKVLLLDLSSKFFSPDQTLPANLMPDGTHPSDQGYQIWADALRSVIRARH